MLNRTWVLIVTLAAFTACAGGSAPADQALDIVNDPSQEPTAMPVSTAVATTGPVSASTPEPTPTALTLSGRSAFAAPVPTDSPDDDSRATEDATAEIVVETPTDEEPTDEVPSDEASSDEAPTDEAPSDEAPTDEAPTEATAAPTAAPDPTIPTPTAEATAAPTVDRSNNAASFANGSELYVASCVRCHGVDGGGDLGFSGVIGAGAKYGRAGLVEELTNGHPFTFGFRDTLSPQQIEDVVAFVIDQFG